MNFHKVSYVRKPESTIFEFIHGTSKNINSINIRADIFLICCREMQ